MITNRIHIQYLTLNHFQTSVFSFVNYRRFWFAPYLIGGQCQCWWMDCGGGGGGLASGRKGNHICARSIMFLRNHSIWILLIESYVYIYICFFFHSFSCCRHDCKLNHISLWIIVQQFYDTQAIRSLNPWKGLELESPNYVLCSINPSMFSSSSLPVSQDEV